MTQWDKLLEKARNNPRGVRFEDACKLAEHFGFAPRAGGGGSHRVFKKKGVQTSLNFQDMKGMAKEYQVKQLLAAIDELQAPTEEGQAQIEEGWAPDAND
jgi:hypothetical protein